MKRLAITVTFLIAVAATPRSIDDKIAADEKSLWEMWKHEDSKSFAPLLADDF